MKTALVVAYGLNEGSGTTTADASGNGKTATLTGATWVLPGKFGAAALSFNGTIGKVITGLGTHAAQRTYMLWTNRQVEAD